MKKTNTILACISTFLAFVIIGCGVTITVEKSDGTKYSYERKWTSQNLENVTFKTSEGAEFSIGKQESNDFQATLNTIQKIAEKIPESVVKAAIPVPIP